MQYQQTLAQSMGLQITDALNMALAHLCHGMNLPFGVANCALVRRVLTLAKNASVSYVPPHPACVGDELLLANYAASQTRSFDRLRFQAATFGITCASDGMTENTVPLINILGQDACSGGVPTPLAIIDCTSWMAEGIHSVLSVCVCRCFVHCSKKYM